MGGEGEGGRCCSSKEVVYDLSRVDAGEEKGLVGELAGWGGWVEEASKLLPHEDFCPFLFTWIKHTLSTHLPD